MSRTQTKAALPPPPRPKAVPSPSGGEREAEEPTISALVLRQLGELEDDEARALAFVELMMQVHGQYPSLIRSEEIAEPIEDVKHLDHEIAVVSLATAYAFGGNRAEEEYSRVLLHYLSGLTEVEQDRLRVRMRIFAARFVDAAQAVSRML